MPVALPADFSARSAACARSIAADSIASDTTLLVRDVTRTSRVAIVTGETLDAQSHGHASILDRTLATRRDSVRGTADALALRTAWHDADLHRRLEPAEGVARTLFSQFERLRYESIGARRFVGVAVNLDNRHTAEMDMNRHATQSPLERVRVLLEALAVTAFRGEAANAANADPGSSTSPSPVVADFRARDLMPADIDEQLARMAGLIDDQAAFAQASLAIIGSMLSSTPGKADFDESLAGTVDTGADEQPTDEALDDEESLAQTETDSESTSLDDEEQVEREEDDSAPDSFAESSDPADVSDALIDEAPQGGNEADSDVRGVEAAYSAWTTRYDEVVHAADVGDVDQLAEWRDTLDQQIERQGRVVTRLAARLQRVLLARQRRQWQFGLDDGELDTSRLAGIITDPLLPLAFKAEMEAPFRDTTVTLLIDNSRSMMGRPIMIAASCADMLARTLERCGVSVEILGFTTAALHGGRSTESWEEAGKPANPGRLNDLRHIIYKSAETPWRKARKQLGLMLNKDILKQNIDGEALLWAHSRLMQLSSQRRILMVISDGSPVDSATLSANPGDCLSRHLHEVIADIQQHSPVQLVAIGIGHDVTSYYDQAMNIYNVRELGPAMLTQLEILFRE